MLPFLSLVSSLTVALLLVLIDRFLTANIHVAIEHLDRHFVKPVVGPSQSLADDLAFTEKSLFDDETAGNFDLGEYELPCSGTP